jgi:hypothetical protein
MLIRILDVRLTASVKLRANHNKTPASEASLRNQTHARQPQRLVRRRPKFASERLG